jgi:hypothetical protein
MALERVLGDDINVDFDLVHPHLCPLWRTVGLPHSNIHPNKQVRHDFVAGKVFPSSGNMA